MMRLSRFEYVAPKSLEEATSTLKEGNGQARLVAGGTDLLVSMKQKLITPKYLVDLSTIPDLEYIRYDEREGLKIGPLTRVRDIHMNPVIKEKYPALAQAALLVARPLHQSMATVGGNICLDARCWYYNQSDFWLKSRDRCIKLEGDVCYIAKTSKVCVAIYSGDIAPSLMAYEATLRLSGAQGDRVIPISEFFTNDGSKETIREVDEVVSEITVPPPVQGSRSTYLKFRLRGAIDFPVVGVAVNLIMDGKSCRKARMVYNAIAPAPLRAADVEEFLTGKELSDQVIKEASERAYREAKPISDTGGFSPVYKKKLVRVMAGDAIVQAIGR